MKLIIQGEKITSSIINNIIKVVQPFSYAMVGDNVWRFDTNDPIIKSEIEDIVEPNKLDIAITPLDSQLTNYKLVAMDMDCTFIQIECIDEIAALYGVKDQVVAITHASMNGELDFNESLIKRVALLEGLEASALQKVYDEKLRLSPGAEVLLNQLQNNGIKTLLVSGGFTFFTQKLKSQYKLDFTRANTLEIVDGKLTGKVLGEIVNAQVKAETLFQCCQQLNISPDETIAIGDGANDLLMLQSAGLSIAYHAKPTLRNAAQLTLDYSGLDGVINIFK